MKNRRVVITGVGPISSLGIGKNNFWNGLLQNKTNVKRNKFKIDGETWESFLYHKIEKFDINTFGIDPIKLRRINDWKEGEENEDLNYILAAIKLAFDDAKIEFPTNKRIGAVIAHENMGLMPFGLKISHLAYDMLIEKKRKNFTKKVFFSEFYKKFIKSGYDIQAFANLFHITQTFSIKDYSLFINNACASGLYAIESGNQIIKNDIADIIVTGVSDHVDIYKYIWFKDIGLYSKTGRIKPFNDKADGIIIGDGAAGIVLEEYEHARKRGATIYAEYLGGGFDLEGWKITVPQIGSLSYQHAMEKALTHTRTSKEEIDLLCTHGVGKIPIDFYESKAIVDVFGKKSQPKITAYKGYLGHTLGASSLLETIIVLLMMHKNRIIASKNCENSASRYNMRLVTKSINSQIKTAMKICCPFAGFNSAIILRKLD